MNQTQLVTGLVVTASLVVSFLLGQPDVVLSPTAKVVLGALNVALVYWSRVSNGGNQTTTVTVTQPTTAAPVTSTVTIPAAPEPVAVTPTPDDPFPGGR